MTITISLPIGSVAQTIAAPFVAAAKFVARYTSAATRYLIARGRAAVMALGRAATAVGHGVANFAASVPSAVKTGVSVSAAFLAQAGSKIWLGAKVAGVFVANFLWNSAYSLWSASFIWFNAIAGAKYGAWAVYAFQVSAILIVVVGVTLAIFMALTAVQAYLARRAQIAQDAEMVTIGDETMTVAQARATAKHVLVTGLPHSEPVPADAPDPEGIVSAGIHENLNTLNDESEAAEKISFQSEVITLIGVLDVTDIKKSPEQVGLDFFNALPKGDKEDYSSARVALKKFVVANKSINGLASKVLNGFDQGRRARQQVPEMGGLSLVK